MQNKPVGTQSVQRGAVLLVVVYPAARVSVSHHHVVSLDLCLLCRQLLALQFQTATTEGVGGAEGGEMLLETDSGTQINTRHRKLAT